MNPTFTVSIDTEKRKASAAGLVAVGEKVDVVVTGLDATQIPEWEQDNDEGFTGPSLRFRLVAPDGKDLVRFPLAEGDAWTIGAEGELTAEVDFNTMPLRHWFHGYEIGAKAEVGMILDSVVDAMEYGRGTVKVLQWTASPAEDPTILPDWRKTLRDLNAAIVEIKDSVDLAEGYADDAEASAGVATEKAGVAVTAANNALSSKSAAEGFKSDAQTAASNAQGYKNDAQLAANTATTKAEEAAGSAGEAAQILEDIEAAIAGKAEQSDFEAEVTRATQKEEELENGLTEANDAISDNADAIDQLEESKADKTALNTLSDAIDSEAETREEKDAAICAKLNKEIADRQDADNLKADKATTYTKTEVDTKIAGVQTFQKYLVQTLPDPDEADMKGLYLVPTGETSEEGDLCEEWTVVEEDGEKRWELIGGTTVDLSDYYNKDAVDGLLAGKEPLLQPLLISGSTIKTVSAIVKNGSLLYPIGIPTSDITVNGKALTGDVTLTGADIAVSGTDATKISAALAGKANAVTPEIQPPYLPPEVFPIVVAYKYQTDTPIFVCNSLEDLQIVHPGSNWAYDCGDPADYIGLFGFDESGKFQNISLRYSVKFNGREGEPDVFPTLVIAPEGGKVIRSAEFSANMEKKMAASATGQDIPLDNEPDSLTIEQAVFSKANKAANPTAGNLASLDSQGNPTNSLIPAANVALKGDIPYDRITITTGQLQDRAVQKVSLSAASTTLTLPALTDLTGKVSDFGIDMVNAYEVSDTPTAASFTLAGTIGTDYNLIVPKGDNWSEMTALAAGEMAQFYFTLSSFQLDSKPTWKVVKQVVQKVTIPTVTP